MAEEGYWYTTKNGKRVFVDGMNAQIRKKAKKDKFANSPIVQNAPDEIIDYLYEEYDRDVVDQSEIDDFITEDFLDDELHDYRDKATQAEYEACYKELERRGYKINYDKKKVKETPKKEQKKETKKEVVNRIEDSYQKQKTQLLKEIEQETDMYAFNEVKNGRFLCKQFIGSLQIDRGFRAVFDGADQDCD